MGTKITDQELALLGLITYIDKNVLNAAGSVGKLLRIRQNQTVKEVLSTFGEKELANLRGLGSKIIDGAMMSGAAWADAIERLQTNTNLNSLTVEKLDTLTTQRGDVCNLQICFGVPDTKQRIITYKGTSGYNEWNDNVEGIIKKDTACQKDAMSFFEKCARDADDVVLVGHSKGANKAMYITVAADSDKISKCVALDGQGFSNKFLRKYDNQIQRRGNLITNYSLDRDFVHVLMKQVPGSNQKYCEGFGITNPAQFHSPNSMFATGTDGKMLLEGNSPKFVFTDENKDVALIRDFVSYTMDNCTNKELRRIAGYLGPIAGETIGNGRIRRGIFAALKRFGTFIAIRRLVQRFAKANNVPRAGFDSLMRVFNVNRKGISIVHAVDDMLLKPAVKVTSVFEIDNRVASSKTKNSLKQVSMDNWKNGISENSKSATKVLPSKDKIKMTAKDKVK